jgi:beta propeller repeat protein
MKTLATTKSRTFVMPPHSIQHRLRASLAVAACALGLLLGLPASAQQNPQTLCARVKIMILQELTLERIGFEATLEVTNNDGEDPITDFSAELTFENPAMSTDQEPNDASPLFFVRAPSIENVNAVDGSGILGPTKKAVVKWFIIPKISAGGRDPNGLRYRVGCTLAGRMRGVEIPKDVLFAIPDEIFVKPEPQLEITYFQPRDVFGDNPFTARVESPIPFTLGVLVKNSGFGAARKLQINSQQPKIVENRQGLLLVAQLLGARVSDSPLSSASLLVSLGDIPPGQARKGAWDMVTSLSGEFIDFKATYTHASDLGGEETSVIKSLATHFIEHEVLNDQPGRDGLREFLADTDRDPARMPDAMFESEGSVVPVNVLANASVQGTAGPGGSFKVTLSADREGWGFVRLEDPGQAKYPIARVVRSDGKLLNENNVWVHRRYSLGQATDLTYLNLLDFVAIGDYTYTVTYAATQADTVAPVTTLRFSGDVSESAGKFYITPDTQMYFTSEDASTVSITYSLTNGPFIPALPFSIHSQGEYSVAYYAEDAFGNREATHIATLVVSVEPPALAQFSAVQGAVFVPGGAISVRPSNASFTYEITPGPTAVDAQFDVFKGAVGWVSVSNVPASPTRASSASLVIGGENVDFFKWRIDGGGWQPESPVNRPIVMDSLAAGTHTVEVLGRPAAGRYPAEAQAVAVSWVTDPQAPATAIAGTPATPSRRGDAQFQVGGTDVTHYRWTIDQGFYRVESPVAAPILLSQLNPGEHALGVLGRVNGVEQGMPTLARWVVDPGYGSDMSLLRRVRSFTVPHVPFSPQTFTWDGKDEVGAIMEPGVYTVRLTLSDRLGRTNFFTRLVHLGEFAGAVQTLADVDRGARNPHARGRTAVWQDQGAGNWQIFAQDLETPGAASRQITSGVRANENPRTDGRYVAWQARQANGNWDIIVRDLTIPASDTPITSTAAADETNPSIDWPWVVYQSKPSNDAAAPSQLRAYNLATHQVFEVWPGPLDQLNPDVQAGRVVWQDHRDVGQGEVYYKHLETGEQRRLTLSAFGQYHPVISGSVVAWQDNRNGQVDVYGYDLLRGTEFRITSTGENEARPFVDGPWLVCEEDSLGPLTGNLRLVHLASLRSVPLTRTPTAKTRAALAGNRAVWQETEGGVSRILSADLPTLQAVFDNQNAIAVTEAMATYQRTAYAVLRSWNEQAGVTDVTRFTSLLPNVASETAAMHGGAPAGTDFPLVPGTFLWVKFGTKRLLDLGVNPEGALDLPAGVSVLSHTRFPNGYTAFKLLEQLGLDRARAVRMLDAESGRWLVAEVRMRPGPEGSPRVPTALGQDFKIPTVAVIFVELSSNVNQWKPE